MVGSSGLVLGWCRFYTAECQAPASGLINCILSVHLISKHLVSRARVGIKAWGTCSPPYPCTLPPCLIICGMAFSATFHFDLELCCLTDVVAHLFAVNDLASAAPSSSAPPLRSEHGFQP